MPCTGRRVCGGHFNEAYQTEEDEALRDDENFCHVAAWEFNGTDKAARHASRNRWALRMSNWRKGATSDEKPSI